MSRFIFLAMCFSFSYILGRVTSRVKNSNSVQLSLIYIRSLVAYLQTAENMTPALAMTKQLENGSLECITSELYMMAEFVRGLEGGCAKMDSSVDDSIKMRYTEEIERILTPNYTVLSPLNS